MRVAPKVILADEQTATLRRWSRGRTTPMRLVRRAQIVLLAAEGLQGSRWFFRPKAKGSPASTVKDYRNPMKIEM